MATPRRKPLLATRSFSRFWIASGLWAGCIALAPTASAQFKVTGPAPYTKPVARQKIRTSLDKLTAANTAETEKTLTNLLVWYRDIFDEEAIAAWQRNNTPELAHIVKALADARVAAAVVDFSWRKQPEAAFKLDYAPMFVDLMVRFPDSSKPFLDDLLKPLDSGQPMPPLAEPVTETMCRIFFDMPDLAAWKRDALRVLPHYRDVADRMLRKDLAGDDEELRDRARFWRSDLRFDGAPDSVGFRRRGTRPAPEEETGGPSLRRSRAVNGVGHEGDGAGPPPVSSPESNTASALRTPDVRTPEARTPAKTQRPTLLQAPAQGYHGPMSGTLHCIDTIAQNAEYVFRGLPPVKLELDFDTKIWDAHLEPGEDQTQKLVLKNKSKGPQKRCVVHWTAQP